MSVSLFDVTIPVFIRGLKNLAAILEKGQAFADEKGMDHQTLLGARLIAEMAPLTAQIQRASDTSKGFAVRVGGVPNVAMEDNEASFSDLQARITATIRFLEGVPREAIEGKEDAPITLKLGGMDRSFTGLGYAMGFAMPNFFFHVTTAYALLRQHGVPIGKMDYLGRS